MLKMKKCLVNSNKFITFVVGIPGYSMKSHQRRHGQKEKRSAIGRNLLLTAQERRY